ncbi:RNA polymerase sigma factor [Rubritalea sp.]|uniref:RNA polymerase sigma factor n=1 Tax=Rubritalea sp. TaxID=2109375 RepID=UPI003EF86A73
MQGNSSFDATRWTLVQRAKDANVEEAQEALNALCSMYWRPLYAFARGYGRSMEDAEDVVQGFLAKGIEKALFSAADQEKGKMRTFLLTAFKRYLRDEHVKAFALKRGEGKVDTMDVAAEEARWADEDATDPTMNFDKRWAIIVVESAREQLEKKYQREGKLDLYLALSASLTGEMDEGYQEVADRLDVSLSAVKVGVHRLRKRFGEMLRAEIVETLGEGEDPDQELRYLIGILSD